MTSLGAGSLGGSGRGEASRSAGSLEEVGLGEASSNPGKLGEAGRNEASRGETSRYAPKRRHEDLTIAVIHHQTPDLLDRCLENLRLAAPEARLVVVDTGESQPLPGSWQERHPGVELLREPNHSYAAPVNAALRECRSSRFAQMNADVLVRQGTFEELADALEESGSAMAGPLPLDGHGRLQRQGLPYRFWQWRARGRRGWSYVPWLSGCLQYLRMDAIDKVGGMDSSLRFYNEDLEWCLRLRSAGERCVLVNTEVTHLGGASTPRSAMPLIEGLRGGFLVTRRYRGPLARWLHRHAVLLGAAAASLVARRPEQRAAYRKAAEMMRLGQFDESPFGDTLGTENSAFLAQERR